jgi:hypothetical protein
MAEQLEKASAGNLAVLLVVRLVKLMAFWTVELSVKPLE